MGIMKILAIGALIVVALYFFAPTQYQSVKATALNLWHSISGKLNTAPPAANTTGNASDTSLQTQSLVNTPTAPVPLSVDGTGPASNTTNTTNTTAPVNTTVAVCDRPHSAFPNYAGTPNVGDTCLDVPTTNHDWECLANPPTAYDGTIDVTLHYSNPEMGCCEGDGKCHWS